MSLIRIVDLSFTHNGGVEPVFLHVSLELNTDWKLGLIGRNGRGKTTFLKLLTGQYPYAGRIVADVGFEYFPYEVPDAQHCVEAIAKRLLGGVWQRWRLIRELSLLDIGEEMLACPFDTLSHGQRTKILLAVMFLRENGFLLIDEPTDHLDLAGREAVSRYLSAKKGFILVSHDRRFLDGCIDHVMSINQRSIDIHQGNFSTWNRNKNRREQFEKRQNDRLRKEIRRLSIASRQAAHWSDRVESTKYNTKNSGLRPDRGFIGHKSAKMNRRAKALAARREQALEKKAGLLLDIDEADALKIQIAPVRKKRLVALDGVSLYYGAREAVHETSLSIWRGERIALCGQNGSGKTSILKLITGGDIRHTGQFYKANDLKISYVPQEIPPLSGSVAQYARENGVQRSQFQTILRKMGFTRQQLDVDMCGFSAGQKKKILIAKSLCDCAHLYVWDEPLNYIDVLSRMQIEEVIQTNGCTMIFVEHDRAFMDAVATRVVQL